MIKFILEISVCPTKNERGNPVEQNVGMSNVALEKNILQKKEEVVWISSEARTDKKNLVFYWRLSSYSRYTYYL